MWQECKNWECNHLAEKMFHPSQSACQCRQRLSCSQKLASSCIKFVQNALDRFLKLIYAHSNTLYKRSDVFGDADKLYLSSPAHEQSTRSNAS